MIAAQAFDPAVSVPGKRLWIYNGRQPYTGGFLTDMDAVSPRVNGWLAGKHDLGRWFYWQSTFWRDGNQGGWGAFDPFVTAETFHNQFGEWAVGDGVLVYPGKQVDAFSIHSLGMAGVVASIRLKNWRRGIQDAGYLKLARAADAARAEAIVKELIPRVLQEGAPFSGRAPSYGDSGIKFFEARGRLLALFSSGVQPSIPPFPAPPDSSQGPQGNGGSSASPGGANQISGNRIEGLMFVGSCAHASRGPRDGERDSAGFLLLSLPCGLWRLRVRRVFPRGCRSDRGPWRAPLRSSRKVISRVG